MTTALFLVAPGALTGAVPGAMIELSGPEGHHAVGVKRVTPGERIDLGDGRGTVVHCEVVELTGRDALRARVGARDVVLRPHPRVTAVQALPKGDRGELAVETLTEVGVDVIVPWQAQRCVARWTGDRAAKGHARWLSAARAAGKQARRAWLPEVANLADTEQVAELVGEATLAVVLHEDGTVPLADLDMPAAGDIVIVVGPEGGLSPEEVDRFAAAGGLPCRMGGSVMRTSTAGTVAAGVVLSRTDRWA